jgi:hypothetical protein
MSRTTLGSVQDLLGPNYDGNTSLEPFIKTASSLTDWVENNDADGVLGESTLERIESFLACHFYAHADQLLQSKSTGAASGAFQGATGMMLKSTQYGQSAMLLDCTGSLAKKSLEAETGIKNVGKIIWLGKN